MVLIHVFFETAYVSLLSQQISIFYHNPNESKTWVIQPLRLNITENPTDWIGQLLYQIFHFIKILQKNTFFEIGSTIRLNETMVHIWCPLDIVCAFPPSQAPQKQLFLIILAFASMSLNASSRNLYTSYIHPETVYTTC